MPDRIHLPLLAVAVLGLLSGQACGAAPHAQREACIDAAAAHYAVPADLVRAVARTEGGTTGQSVGNANGSRDMGLMQVNSVHLPELARYGITRDMLINNECLNIHVGTFILHRELQRDGDYWTNVGAYNSRTPEHNVRYRTRVWNNLLHIWQGQ